jgi:hypothetical protein
VGHHDEAHDQRKERLQLLSQAATDQKAGSLHQDKYGEQHKMRRPAQIGRDRRERRGTRQR